MTITLKIQYSGKKTKKNSKAARETLENAMSFIAGNGLFTEGSGLEIDSWSSKIEEAAE